jgi:hypothetical protein
MGRLGMSQTNCGSSHTLLRGCRRVQHFAPSAIPLDGANYGTNQGNPGVFRGTANRHPPQRARRKPPSGWFESNRAYQDSRDDSMASFHPPTNRRKFWANLKWHETNGSAVWLPFLLSASEFGSHRSTSKSANIVCASAKNIRIALVIASIIMFCHSKKYFTYFHNSGCLSEIFQLNYQLC